MTSGVSRFLYGMYHTLSFNATSQRQVERDFGLYNDRCWSFSRESIAQFYVGNQAGTSPEFGKRQWT